MLGLRRQVAIALTAVLSLAGADARADAPNLLPNGGFETDADGEGVADGWVAQPFNFARESLDDVEAFLERFPSREKLLEGRQVVAADGTVLYERDAEQNWGADLLGTDRYWDDNSRGWYDTLRNRRLPQHARFGELPVLEGLDLGRVTLVLRARRPHGQVVSEPIPVKAGTGYRLTFHVRVSGGGEFLHLAQVLDGAFDPASVPIEKDHYGSAEVLNAMPAGHWWGAGVAGRYWARLELPFRTLDATTSIRIRLPYRHRAEDARKKMSNQHYRIWYDDLRLVEDDTARVGDIGHPDGPQAQWPAEAIERGFVAAPRPTLPMTVTSFVPTLEQTQEPIALSLAAGESDSTVVFVRNLLSEGLVVRAVIGQLTCDSGYGLHAAYGARFVKLRAVETAWRRHDAKRYDYAPRFLLNRNDLALRTGHGGQIWMTVTVPPRTPAGLYTGTLTLTRTRPDGGESSAKQLDVPVRLTVRDIHLEEASVAFFTWYNTPPVEGPMGPASALPGAEEIYLLDQRRHGMNTVATYSYAERQDRDGVVRITYNELDAMVESVRRAGLCRSQPMILHTWSRPLEIQGRGDFSVFAGGEGTVNAIVEHARRSGWPGLLFGVSDEPAKDENAARVATLLREQYAGPRRRGVRTGVATGRWGALTRPLPPDGHTLGELYDVWIEATHGSEWPQMHAAAAKQNAEVWMYNCWFTGAGYLQERFNAGLWTWRTGAKGNGVWSYGWYVRIDASGVPESKIAFEGRLAGVNDYRYLQTLQGTIAAGEGSGRAGAAVQGARDYLDRLRRRIPYTAYRRRPGAVPQNQWAELDAWNPVPDIEPAEYARIRDTCAGHIIAIRRECGLAPAAAAR